MNWYKKANEFVGADASLANGTHISDITKRNIDHQYLSPTVNWNQHPELTTDSQGRSVRTNCEKCGMELEEFEKLGYFFKTEGGKEEEAYSCSNCGYRNHYSRRITRKKKKSRLRKRRRAGVLMRIVTASPYGTTFQGWQTGNNPANTPMGRLDLSQDERMATWDKFQDGFDNEWDSQKQKKNDEDYEVIKIKGKDGKIKYVRLKKRTTGGDAVQPSNTYTQKGRVKKQRRYNPKDGKGKDNPGAWPHNRNMVGPGSGGYQMPYSQNLDSDMRQRVVDWYDHLTNRNMYSLSRPY